MDSTKHATGGEARPATELITVAWADAHAPAGYVAVKRALDVAVVLLVLVIGLPVWLLIALLIKLSSAGPVFYRGTVIGRGGVAFRYYKFRTMVTGGDNTAHKQWLEQFVKQDAAFANVLTGDMSLVGPRPPVPYEYEHYDDWARQRLSVTPGITGLYQVTARSQVGFSGMVAIDLDYIRRRSFWLDVQIMLKTPVVMILGKGAG